MSKFFIYLFSGTCLHLHISWNAWRIQGSVRSQLEAWPAGHTAGCTKMARFAGTLQGGISWSWLLVKGMRMIPCYHGLASITNSQLKSDSKRVEITEFFVLIYRLSSICQLDNRLDQSLRFTISPTGSRDSGMLWKGLVRLGVGTPFFKDNRYPVHVFYWVCWYVVFIKNTNMLTCWPLSFEYAYYLLWVLIWMLTICHRRTQMIHKSIAYP